MTELMTWFTNNNLTLNSNKTKIMHFSAMNRKDKKVNINENIDVDSVKFLGIAIDNTLHWEVHIKNLSKKLASINYTLLSLKTITDHSTLLLAYFGLFQSRISYGIAFWGGRDSTLKKIFLHQKRAIRIIFNLGVCDSCKLYFKAENILTLPSIYILQISEMVMNKTIITPNTTHHYETRGRNLIHTNSFRLNLFQCNIDYQGPKVFNNLPPQIKNVSHPVKFKKKMKEWLLRKAYYSLEEFFEDKDDVWSGEVL